MQLPPQVPPTCAKVLARLLAMPVHQALKLEVSGKPNCHTRAPSFSSWCTIGRVWLAFLD